MANKLNLKRIATKMIRVTAESDAVVVTQWGDVDPLTAWVREYPTLPADKEALEPIIGRTLRKLTTRGFRTARGGEFGGYKLMQSPNNTWVLLLYGQFDIAPLIELI